MTLAGPGMIAAGAALLWFGRWLARNDVAWLSAVIAGALDGKGGAQAGEVASVTQPPRIIAVVSTVLTASGVAAWLAAITGISAFHAGPGGVEITHFHDMRLRLVAAGFGIAELSLALGVYRQRVVAWRAGFALLAGGWGYSVAVALSSRAMSPVHGIVIAFAALSFLIMLFWGRWWYIQRTHFRD